MPNSSPVSSIAARIEPLSRPPESSTTGLLVARLQAAISSPRSSLFPAGGAAAPANPGDPIVPPHPRLPPRSEAGRPMPLNEGRQPREHLADDSGSGRRPRARPCGSSRGTSRGPRVSWCRQPGPRPIGLEPTRGQARPTERAQPRSSQPRLSRNATLPCRRHNEQTDVHARDAQAMHSPMTGPDA